MKCPNCGTSYEENHTICPSCGQPLSNAHYTPVDARSPGRHKKKRRIRSVLLFIFLFLTICGIVGYCFYIRQIASRCEEAVHDIFAMAKEMDFSDVDPSYLPETLRENPNIRDSVRTYVDNALEEYQVNGLLESVGIEIDTDMLCDEITQSASYEITGTQASYNRCTISVHTENTDFSALPATIAEEIANNYSGSSFWENLQKIFDSIFSGHSHESEEAEESDVQDFFSSLYENFRETAPTTETDGTIVFGIRDGQWTLLSMDEELFYSYYGLSALSGDNTTDGNQ